MIDEYKALDEALEYLNEGKILNKITGAVRNKIGKSKIDNWIKEAKAALAGNDSYTKIHKLIMDYYTIEFKYGSTKYYKSKKRELERLVDSLRNKYEEQYKKACPKIVEQLKKKWDGLKVPISETWEGEFLSQWSALGIPPETVIKHYAKSSDKRSYKKCIECMGELSDFEEYGEKYLLDKCSLDDECIEFYGNDDALGFYDYTSNKLIEVLTNYKVKEVSVSDLYDFAWADEYEYYNQDLIATAKELKIKFTV
jgi:hypothetical protein